MEMSHPHINSGVYVLRLEDGKFYVGASQDFHQRLNNHSSAWTEEFEPVEVVDVFPAKDDLHELEREVTLMVMEEHGWENVRGAGWTQVNMSNPPRALRENVAT